MTTRTVEHPKESIRRCELSLTAELRRMVELGEQVLQMLDSADRPTHGHLHEIAQAARDFLVDLEWLEAMTYLDRQQRPDAYDPADICSVCGPFPPQEPPASSDEMEAVAVEWHRPVRIVPDRRP